ncbi:MAG: hypothetical protein ACKKL5_00720 [Candidatus Komeilibacteria bacterium]
MAKGEKQYVDEQYVGQEIMSWAVPEYPRYQRDLRWYVIAVIVAILFLLYSVLTANLLFGLIIIMAAVTIFYFDRHQAPMVDFVITNQGFKLHDKFYEFSGVKSFYIIFEPPHVQSLFIEFNNSLRPRLNIPLQDHDPSSVRKVLKEYLKEDLEREGEPISEALGRIFKL